MLDDRFWSKVKTAGPDECWGWHANKNNKGYGMFSVDSFVGKKLAHRLSYADAFGPIGPGLVIRHSCDNPACVNPRHLKAGTQKQNMEDAAWRERVGNTMLTADQVVSLWRDYIAGMPRKELAPRYGLSLASLSDYTDGKAWRHLLGRNGAPTLADLQAAKRRKPAARLCEDDVRTIRRRLAAGETCGALGREYGITRESVRDIKRGRNWKGVV